MAIIIGSARIDERGKAKGGKVGDQTRKEVTTQEFYVHPKGWYILRAKNINHANKIAEAMKIACANDNIGYDQSNRLGVITYGVNTQTKTEADCSSLVRACIIYATGSDVGNFNTASQVKTLEKSGLFEKHITYNSNTALYNGDILVTKTQGHTVVVVSGANSRNPQPTPKPTPQPTPQQSFLPARGYFKYGDNNANVGKIASFMYKTFPAYTPKAALGNLFGPRLMASIKTFQKRTGLTPDGCVGPLTLKKLEEYGFKH